MSADNHESLTGLDHAVARAMHERGDWIAVAVIARDAGKTRETVQYRLGRMLRAGFSKKRRLEPTGRAQVWKLTEAGVAFAKGMPPTPHARAEYTTGRYDHRALSAAMGVPASASFAVTGRVHVHHCMGGA